MVIPPRKTETVPRKGDICMVNLTMVRESECSHGTSVKTEALYYNPANASFIPRDELKITNCQANSRYVTTLEHVSPYLVNWYHSFLSGRQQRIFCLVTITVGGKPSIRALHKVVLVAPISLIFFLTILKLHMMASLRYSNMLMIQQLLHQY